MTQRRWLMAGIVMLAFAAPMAQAKDEPCADQQTCTQNGCNSAIKSVLHWLHLDGISCDAEEEDAQAMDGQEEQSCDPQVFQPQVRLQIQIVLAPCPWAQLGQFQVFRMVRPGQCQVVPRGSCPIADGDPPCPECVPSMPFGCVPFLSRLFSQCEKTQACDEKPDKKCCCGENCKCEGKCSCGKQASDQNCTSAPCCNTGRCGTAPCCGVETLGMPQQVPMVPPCCGPMTMPMPCCAPPSPAMMQFPGMPCCPPGMQCFPPMMPPMNSAMPVFGPFSPQSGAGPIGAAAPIMSNPPCMPFPMTPVMPSMPQACVMPCPVCMAPAACVEQCMKACVRSGKVCLEMPGSDGLKVTGEDLDVKLADGCEWSFCVTEDGKIAVHCEGEKCESCFTAQSDKVCVEQGKCHLVLEGNVTVKYHWKDSKTGGQVEAERVCYDVTTGALQVEPCCKRQKREVNCPVERAKFIPPPPPFPTPITH